jgi:signal transduction histidine kinase
VTWRPRHPTDHNVPERMNADRATVRLRSLVLSSRPWRAAAFMLLSFPFGMAAFVALVTLAAVGFGLLIVWVGVPILAATMVGWTLAAGLERRRVRLFFGVEIPTPYRPAPDGGVLRKLRGRAGDPAVWRDLGYLVLLFPVGVGEFVVVVAGLSVSAAVFALPALAFTQPHAAFHSPSDAPPIGVAVAAAVLAVPVAVVVLLLFAGIGRVHVGLARALLGPSRSSRLEKQVSSLTDTRSRAVESALDDRRRIERDLHDGAQQRLVALALDLGMAKEKLASDPDAARELVEGAHEEAKRALSEIRDLVRGIHPAVLTDRGLDAAVSALAARMPIPVSVCVEVRDRPPDAVESTAYFIVSEALANVAKHSGATAAAVTVREEGDQLVVEVVDDGAGGADVVGGTGLRGLAARVEALDGTFTVADGAGTTVRAELPCGW